VTASSPATAVRLATATATGIRRKPTSSTTGPIMHNARRGENRPPRKWNFANVDATFCD
jgi:hypothetical protein